MLSNKTLFVGTMLGEVNPTVLDKKRLKNRGWSTLQTFLAFTDFWVSNAPQKLTVLLFETSSRFGTLLIENFMEEVKPIFLQKKNVSEYQDWPIIGRLWHFRLSRFRSQLENHLFGKSFSSEWCSAVASMERISRVFQERYEIECP